MNGHKYIKRTGSHGNYKYYYAKRYLNRLRTGVKARVKYLLDRDLNGKIEIKDLKPGARKETLQKREKSFRDRAKANVMNNLLGASSSKVSPAAKEQAYLEYTNSRLSREYNLGSNKKRREIMNAHLPLNKAVRTKLDLSLYSKKKHIRRK